MPVVSIILSLSKWIQLISRWGSRKNPIPLHYRQRYLEREYYHPRGAAIKNIIITPSGQGIDVSPTQKYISSLNGHSSAEIPFSVTPNQDSVLTFHISYQNGDNDHSAEVVLPVVLGDNKKAAIPLVNNVELASSGASYTLTGDINNAGLTDAKSMVVTVGSPANAVEPYAYYSIGSLASDDFSSFEITFTANDLSSCPWSSPGRIRTGTHSAVQRTLISGQTPVRQAPALYRAVPEVHPAQHLP